MTDNTKKLLDEAMEALGADSCKRGKDWNGYEVYIPVYGNGGYVGLPLVVLVKDGDVRISTEEEAFEYLDHENN